MVLATAQARGQAVREVNRYEIAVANRRPVMHGGATERIDPNFDARGRDGRHVQNVPKIRDVRRCVVM
jgi:hypothetical protein